MMKTALFAVAAALATAATAAPVLAKDVLVHHGDLNLGSVEGQRTLSQRIDRAARKACDFNMDGRLPTHAAMVCYRQARARAKNEMAAKVDAVRLGG